MVSRLSWRRLRSPWFRSPPRGLHLRPSSRSRFPPAQHRSLLLNQRGPTGVSIKSSPVAPPDRSVSSCRHSCSSPSATSPVESRRSAGVARSPAPSEPRAAASDPTASAARKASQRRRASGAAEARQRRRGKHGCWVRYNKRSMWREIQGQAPACRSTRACCTDTSSDDDDHNTDSDALLLFCHAVVTIIQQDYPVASDDHAPLPVSWLTNQCSVVRH